MENKIIVLDEAQRLWEQKYIVAVKIQADKGSYWNVCMGLSPREWVGALEFRRASNTFIQSLIDTSCISICDIEELKKIGFRYYGKPKSYLEDRQHYARSIMDGTLTRKQVVTLTGYHYYTVCRWVNDYKKFGNKMTSQAIAFRREL